jgi:hypothetical protein
MQRFSGRLIADGREQDALSPGVALASLSEKFDPPLPGNQRSAITIATSAVSSWRRRRVFIAEVGVAAERIW